MDIKGVNDVEDYDTNDCEEDNNDSVVVDNDEEDNDYSFDAADKDDNEDSMIKIQQLIQEHDEADETFLEHQIVEDVQDQRGAEVGVVVIDSSNHSPDLLKEMQSMYVTNPYTNEKWHKKKLPKELMSGTSTNKSIGRKYQVQDLGSFDDGNGKGQKDTVCTHAFKFSYNREDMASEPISGANILVEGDYCGVIVKSKPHPSNDSESVQGHHNREWSAYVKNRTQYTKRQKSKTA